MAAELVQLFHGEPVTTSLAIAEGVGLEHKQVIAMVRKYIPELQKFGRVAFETAPFETSGGIQYRELAYLNEPQATFLITCMRNSPVVIEFKLALVRAFFGLRDGVRHVESEDGPALPNTPAHRSDHVVAAARTFNGLLRAARGMRLSHARAVAAANEATRRATGVDLVEELGADDVIDEPPVAVPAGVEDHPWFAPVRDWLAQTKPERTTTAQVLHDVLQVALPHRRADQMQAGAILRQLGMRRVCQRSGNDTKWWYVAKTRSPGA